MYGVLFTVGMMISFAISLSITRNIEDQTSPIFNNGVRIIIGVLTFNLIALFNHSWGLIYTVPLKYQIFLFLSIICNVLIGDTVYFIAQMKIGPIYAGSVSTVMPLISFLLEVFVLNQRLSFWIFISAIITGIGVSVIFYSEKTTNNTKSLMQNQNLTKNQDAPTTVNVNQLSTQQLIIGLGAGLISAVAWAFGNFFIAIGLTGVQTSIDFAGSITHTAFALRYNFALVIFAFYGIFYYGKRRKTQKLEKEHPQKKSVRTWSLAIIAAILFTSIGTFFYGEATQDMGPTFVSIFNTTLPLFQFPINWIINHEKIKPLGALGCIITILGVILLLLTT